MKTGVSVNLCFLLMIPCSAWDSTDFVMGGRPDYGTSIEDVSRYSRIKRSVLTFSIKRAIAGVTAAAKLLKGSIPLYSPVPRTSRYVKPGTYKTAFDDFLSVKPNNVREFELPDGAVGATGMVGDRIIRVEHRADAGRTTMKIYKHKDTRRERYKHIEYVEPQSKLLKQNKIDRSDILDPIGY